MILIGYLTIFIYIFSLIFIIGPIIKKVTNLETSRKIIHILLFAVWIFLDIFMKDTIHQVIVPIIFLILNSLSYKFNIYKSIERESGNHLGTIYFAIAITIIMLFVLIFPDVYYCSGIATLCLTFGDGFAALIGYNTKSRKIYQNKTLNGFVACFLFSSISTFIFSHFYNIEINLLMCFIIGLAVAIFELIGKGLDNFFVVFISFVLSYLFLYCATTVLFISVILAEVIFIIVFTAKSIDYYGSILSMLMVFSYMYFGGELGISILLSEYFFIFLVGLIKKLKHKHKNKKEKGSRTFLQILINGGLGTLFVILYGIFKVKSLLIISIISVSGCFIDSVSSDVGTFSITEPYDIFKRKKVTKGLSGGISILGTASSLICAGLISAFTCISMNLNISNFIIITSIIFGQTIVDSFLGSIVQVKYICKKCKRVSEKNICCNTQTEKISGISWINNNMVNLMSSIIITIVASVIYLIL